MGHVLSRYVANLEEHQFEKLYTRPGRYIFCVNQVVKIVTHIITVPLLDWKNPMKSVLLALSALKQLFSRNLMIMQLVESVEKVNIVFKELNTIVNQVLMLQYLD